MNKLRNAMRNRKGFTMIELIMVILVLGLLAAVAYPRITEQRDAGYMGQANGVLTTVREGMANLYKTQILANNMVAYDMEDILPLCVFEGIDFDVAPVAAGNALTFTLGGTVYAIALDNVALPTDMGELDPDWLP